MGKSNIIMIMLLALILVSSVSAASLYKAGEPVNLKITCKNNGTLCSSSALCNLTIYRELTGAVVVQDKPMAYSYSYFSYSVPASNDLGVYKGTIYCIDNGLGGVSSISYELTSTGQDLNTGTKTFVILILFSIALLVLSFIFHNYIFSFISGLSFGLTGVYSMIYGFASPVTAYTRMLSTIIIGLGIIITVVSAIEMIKESEDGESSISISEDDDNFD